MIRPRRAVLCCTLGLVVVSSASRAGEFQQPELVKATEVVAPNNAPTPKQDHVVVEFTISAEAEVQDIAIIESAGDVWDEAVRQALKTWQFKAAKHEGAPAPSRTQLSVRLPRTSVDAGTFDAGPPPPPTPVFDAGAPVIEEVDAGHPLHEMSTTVTARTAPKSRGPSDQYIEIGELKAVPRPTAGEYLKLAPGILLTNEGGDGHPDRIFLRGFDAREGQDLELSVDGVPVNDSGNLHGNGYADLNFVIPELVENLRVIEGPFDPRQGNYAVAGSADYELGLTKRGLTAKLGVGSFNSQRLVFLWGPPRESTHTFAGAQVQRSDGFGQNRSAQSARFMAQYEGTADATTFRIAATGSAAQFRMAGVVREDDFQAGRLGFFDTYDDRQGGESARASLSGEVHHHREGFTNHHQVFVTYRGSRLLENFTGFLYDGQKAQQTPHGQRGDLLDRSVMAVTAGARGYGRLRGKVFNRAQELELGYFARFDVTAGQQQRILAGPQSNTPYAKDADLLSRLTDLGMYADVNLSPVWWLAVRGGVRTDVFTYSVDNHCAVSDVRRPSQTNPPGDASCLSQRDFGLYREPTERVSAAGAAVMPRVTAVVGPFEGVSISGAFGDGVRSVDPQYVTENRQTPFASIRAWEGGVTYTQKLLKNTLDVSGRAVVFGTHVDKDLIFSEQAGRNIIGGGTTRLGGLVQGRVRGSFFDVAAHGTYVSSRFDDTGLLVPYVPDLVVRGDGALFHSLGLAPLGTPIQGTLGVGLTYVGRRALPFGQRSDVIFTTDVNAELSWRFVTLGLSATNLFNAQYRLSEFNFASDFRLTGPSPTLVPSRHFTAGAPRQLFVTVSFNVGGEP